jgi:hypothetical protein
MILWFYTFQSFHTANRFKLMTNIKTFPSIRQQFVGKESAGGDVGDYDSWMLFKTDLAGVIGNTKSPAYNLLFFLLDFRLSRSLSIQ